jgi:hypothetical protein
MKMSPTLRLLISTLIEPLDTEETRTAYREGHYPRPAQDVNKRYRWDLFRAANAKSGYAITSIAYDTENLHDGHIDSALRKIVPAL